MKATPLLLFGSLLLGGSTAYYSGNAVEIPSYPRIPANTRILPRQEQEFSRDGRDTPDKQDCLTLYYSCLDNKDAGLSGNTNECEDLFNYCSNYNNPAKPDRRVVEEDNIQRASSNSKGGCSTGWEHFGDKCFYFSRGEIVNKWADAEAKCKSIHPTAYLASIHSELEQQFVAGRIERASFIGANDLTSEGEWTWSDGSAWNYTNWHGSEPNGKRRENCGRLEVSNGGLDWKGGWNDKVCQITNSRWNSGYVCSYYFSDYDEVIDEIRDTLNKNRLDWTEADKVQDVKIGQLDNSVRAVEKDLGAVQKDFNKLVQDVESNIGDVNDRLNNSLTDVEADIEDVESELKKYGETIKADLETNIEDVNETLTIAQNELKQTDFYQKFKLEKLSNNTDKLKDEVAIDQNKLHGRVDSVESGLKAVQTEWKKTVDAIENNVKDVKVDLEKHVQDVEDNVGTVKNILKESLTLVSDKIGTVKNDLNKRLGTLETEVENTVANLSNSIGSVETDVGGLENRLNNSVRTVVKDITEISNLVTTVEDNFEAEIEKIKETLNTTHLELEETDELQSDLIENLRKHTEGFVLKVGAVQSRVDTVEDDVEGVRKELNEQVDALGDFTASVQSGTIFHRFIVNECDEVCGTRNGRDFPRCPLLTVTGADANAGGVNSNGEFQVVIDEVSRAAPDRFVYKHVSQDRYIFFWQAQYGWRLGSKDGLKTGSGYHFSGLDTKEPWEGRWEDPYPWVPERPAPKVTCREHRFTTCLKCILRNPATPTVVTPTTAADKWTTTTTNGWTSSNKDSFNYDDAYGAAPFIENFNEYY